MTDPRPTELLLGDIEAVIRDQARGNWRSQQVAVGPSSLGQACERRLALELLGAEKVNTERDEWTSTVGTALHTWMDGAFRAANNRLTAAGKPPRWLVEQAVTIRPGMIGHCDVYDLWSQTVCDWKFPGVTAIRKYRKQGHPGKQYRWQAHVYGYGWAKIGLPVKTVAICCLPRSGLVRDAWMWSEPYSEAVAEEAFRRVDGLLVSMDSAESLGELPTLLSELDRDTDNCSWCPYWTHAPGPATDPAAGCAGEFEDADYAAQAAKATPTIPGII